jgi:hypothetical protein
MGAAPVGRDAMHFHAPPSGGRGGSARVPPGAGTEAHGGGPWRAYLMPVGPPQDPRGGIDPHLTPGLFREGATARHGGEPCRGVYGSHVSPGTGCMGPPAWGSVHGAPLYFGEGLTIPQQPPPGGRLPPHGRPPLSQTRQTRTPHELHLCNRSAPRPAHFTYATGPPHACATWRRNTEPNGRQPEPLSTHRRLTP